MVVQFQEENDSLALDLLKSVAIGLAAIVLGSLIWAAIAYYFDRASLWVAWLIGAGVAYALFLPFKRITIGVVLALLPITLIVTLACVVVGDVLAIVLTVLADPAHEFSFLQTLLAAVLTVPQWLFQREILVTLGVGLFGSLLGYLAVARKHLRRGKPMVTSSKVAPLPGAEKLPARFAEVNHLGEVQHVFLPSTVKRVAGLFGYGFFMFLSLAMLGLMLFIAVNKPTQDIKAMILVVATFGGCFILLGYYFVRALMRWHECGVVYDNGFAYFNGKQMRAWASPEIAEIKADIREVLIYGLIKVGTRQKYTLTNTQGETFKLQDELKNVAQFIQLLQQQSDNSLRTRIIQQLERGDSVPFGKLALNRDGIQIEEGSLLTWGEIANVSLNDGTLVIKRNDNALFPNISISASQIANLNLFMSLLFDESKK